MPLRREIDDAPTAATMHHNHYHSLSKVASFASKDAIEHCPSLCTQQQHTEGGAPLDGATSVLSPKMDDRGELDTARSVDVSFHDDTDATPYGEDLVETSPLGSGADMIEGTATGRCASVGAVSAATDNGPQEDASAAHYPSQTGVSQTIVLGVCCMAKKLRSATMTAMLKRFEEFSIFRIVAFPEETILEVPVERWPRVDVMISFFSSGFPLHKAVEYAQRHPDIFFLTHPASQQVLLDRRGVYSALRRNNVPVVRSVYCSRDGHDNQPPAVLIEHIEEEWISVNGQRFYKPFVEKPVDAEDHNVYIYYDKTRGGGCRMLFRKKENQSSAYEPDRVHVRQEGSFVYEEYIETANFMDIKCYTVGVSFVHAEQRKAPCVDGVVLRSESGKEIREDVQLSPEELMVARKVIKVFRQLVCGFDLLRTFDRHGKPTFFVCDVNGWSFVKNNPDYVIRATEIMKNIFVEEVRKRGLHRVCASADVHRIIRMTPKSSSDSVSFSVGAGAAVGGSAVSSADTAVSESTNRFLSSQPRQHNTSSDDVSHAMTDEAQIDQLHEQQQSAHHRSIVPRELIGVVGVLRHADRTPKQKVKILLSAEVLLDIVFGTTTPPPPPPPPGGGPLPPPTPPPSTAGQTMNKELVFKCGHPVLARIQLCAEQLLDEMTSSEDASSHGSTDVSGVIHTTRGSLPEDHERRVVLPLPSEAFVGASPQPSTEDVRAIPFRAHAAGDNPTQSVEEQLRLIIDVLNRKHEGLKVQIRPSEWDDNGKCIEALLICKWGGWLTDAGHKQAEMLGNHFIRRMFGAEPSEHCVSRDQLLITTNNERRVIYTGLDFARCLLKDRTINESQCHVNEPLLGCSAHAKELLGRISDDLSLVMHIDTDDAEGIARVEQLPGMRAILRCCVLDAADRSPRGALRALHRMMEQLVDHIPPNDALHVHFYRDEPIHLMRRRWQTITRGFYNRKKGCYDTSKITELFDYVSYDVCYNQEALAPLDLYPLFTLAEAVSQFVSDGEYGLTADQKRLTGCLIATPLLHRINADLHSLAMHRSPLTRLYFTSQSHVMALKNLLYHSDVPFHRLDEPQALHFLTHIVFKAYRYVDTGAVQLEVHFSAGMDKNMFGIVQEHHVAYSAVTPMIRIHNDLSLAAIQRMAASYDALFQSSVPQLTPLSPLCSGADGHAMSSVQSLAPVPSS